MQTLNHISSPRIGLITNAAVPQSGGHRCTCGRAVTANRAQFNPNDILPEPTINWSAEAEGRPVSYAAASPHARRPRSAPVSPSNRPAFDPTDVLPELTINWQENSRED